MNFIDIEHDRAIERIQRWYKDGKSWEDIKELQPYKVMLGNIDFSMLMGMAQSVDSFKKTYSQEEWNSLVEHVRSREEPKIKRVTKLAPDTKNDAEISTQAASAWQLYKGKLHDKNWSIESIEYIQDSAYEILQMLSQDTESDSPVKGLVLGNVQSGKTANMAGLIAMAADYGFNCFIILSGMIENLRKQTERRLYSDLSSPGNLNWHIISSPHPTKTVSLADRMQNMDLSEGSNKRYMTVVLKNSTRMKNLVRWLYSDVAKASQLKVLIIDDEADQASINTRKMELDDGSKEEIIERTAINKSIIELVHGVRGIKLKAANYISYTATPYANILNEASVESLYPKDFIVSLEPAGDYIGPKQIFGLSEPETTASLDIIREIPEKDIELLDQIHKGEYFYPPTSLMKSIQWFLMTTVAMKYKGYKSPISMLIHTSQKISDHTELENVITNYLLHIRKVDTESFLHQCENLYLEEKHDFTKSDFISGMPSYSSAEEAIKDYPEWNIIKEGLRALLVRDEEEYLSHIQLDEDGDTVYHRGIHLCIDNSKNGGREDEFVRLVYPDKNKKLGFAPVFIVIGGNTLSRGLTLEGLTTSYFMRNTVASDTLMQMGRWFGFRKGYELYPRIWMNELVKNRFEFISQLDQDLRDEIEEFRGYGKSPRDFGIRVKNSPNNAFIRITSANKMQNALPARLDFSGVQMQTITFEDNKKMLDHNLSITDKLLNNLPEPEVNGSRLVWKNVSFEILNNEFFSQYKVSGKDIRFSNLEAFMKWCKSVDEKNEFDNWNVILSSKGELSKQSINRAWNVQGYAVTPVRRSVLSRQSDGRTVSIGALRSPKDLLSDIIELKKEDDVNTPTIREARKIREQYGYQSTPQLVIYRIDRKSVPYTGKKSNKTDSFNKRTPLNFSQDIIGISIMMPGTSSSKSLAEQVIIRLPEIPEE